MVLATAPTARLKSCPDTGFRSVRLKSCPDTGFRPATPIQAVACPTKRVCPVLKWSVRFREEKEVLVFHASAFRVEQQASGRAVRFRREREQPERTKEQDRPQAAVRDMIEKIEKNLDTKKATLGHIRLLQLERELETEHPSDVEVKWVDEAEGEDCDQ